MPPENYTDERLEELHREIDDFTELVDTGLYALGYHQALLDAAVETSYSNPENPSPALDANWVSDDYEEALKDANVEVPSRLQNIPPDTMLPLDHVVLTQLGRIGEYIDVNTSAVEERRNELIEKLHPETKKFAEDGYIPESLANLLYIPAQSESNILEQEVPPTSTIDQSMTETPEEIQQEPEEETVPVDTSNKTFTEIGSQSDQVMEQTSPAEETSTTPAAREDEQPPHSTTHQSVDKSPKLTERETQLLHILRNADPETGVTIEDLVKQWSTAEDDDRAEKQVRNALPRLKYKGVPIVNIAPRGRGIVARYIVGEQAPEKTAQTTQERHALDTQNDSEEAYPDESAQAGSKKANTGKKKD